MHTWLQVLCKNRILHFISKLNHGVNLLLRLLALLDKLLEVLIDCVFSSQERNDEIFLQWEASFD